MSITVTSLLPSSLETIRSRIEESAEPGEIFSAEKLVKQEWIGALLRKFHYEKLGRDDKGLIRNFIQRETGYSRAQTARLIKTSLAQEATVVLEEAKVSGSTLSTAELCRLSLRKHALIVERCIISAVIVVLLLLVSGTRQMNTTGSLVFLNGDVAKVWDVHPGLSAELDPKEILNGGFDHTIAAFTAVRTVDIDGQVYPLFLQQEEITVTATAPVAYVKSVGSDTSELLANVEARRETRISRLDFSNPIGSFMSFIVPDRKPSLNKRTRINIPVGAVQPTVTTMVIDSVPESSAQSGILNAVSLVDSVAARRAKRLSVVTPVATAAPQEIAVPVGAVSLVTETVNPERYIRLPESTVKQTFTSQIRGHIDGDIPVVSAISDFVQRVLGRREERLNDMIAAGVPYEQILFKSAPEFPEMSPITSAPSLWSAIGAGENGQVLMTIDGTLVWTFLNESNINELASGYISRRGGGSGRSGGGGSSGAAGADGATGATGATGPAGPTLGIYDSLGLASSGSRSAGDAGGLTLYNLGLLEAATASGAIVHATDSLTSSGNLVVESNIELHGTLSGVTIVGFGLSSNCTGSNKVTWNSTTKKFECAEDLTVGTGLSQTSGDARYVNVAGDTMTGALVINNQITGAQAALEVSGVASGYHLRAQDLLTSSGSLVVERVTTLNDEVVFGSGIIVRGITYRFPGSQGSSGTILATDGIGNLT
ncbi:hypothetical protein FJZ28_02750, partial [Candidatus Peregrinibacteria bacterium]|nr:hypothetical protein [Candidatus Peregrinibacteria bacterium]